MTRDLDGPVAPVRRARTALAATMLLAAVLAAAPSAGEIVERVLAVVDGHLITLSDVHTVRTLGLVQAAPAAGSADPAVEQLIDRVLVLQEVERYAPPAPDEAVIDASVRAIAQADQASGPLVDRLGELGVSAAWLRQWIRDDLRIQAYLDQRFAGVVQPTEEELEAYFREHRAEFAADGRELSEAAAQQLARERVTAVRRQTLVADWVKGLRRRAEILRPGAQ